MQRFQPAQLQSPSGRHRRRLVWLGAGLLALAPFARAQQPARVWRVGVLVLRDRPASLEGHFLGALAAGLRDLGYVEGRNLLIEWRFADGSFERLEAMARELVRSRVDVIVTGITQAVSAVQKTGTAVPIVMAGISDPVVSGFVRSLARPGTNVTGLSHMLVDLGPKQLEMLQAAKPGLSRVGVLTNPTNSSHTTVFANIQAALPRGMREARRGEARNPAEIDAALSGLARQGAEAIVVAQDALFIQQAVLVGNLAMKRRLPTIAGFREFAVDGGLMSYGQNLALAFRGAATYVDKILRGAQPADLPVEQPARLELVINLKTARALNLRLPQEVTLRADQVIE